MNLFFVTSDMVKYQSLRAMGLLFKTCQICILRQGAHFPIAEVAATLDQIGGLELAKIIMARCGSQRIQDGILVVLCCFHAVFRRKSARKTIFNPWHGTSMPCRHAQDTSKGLAQRHAPWHFVGQHLNGPAR